MNDSYAPVVFMHHILTLPAFDMLGYTAIVESGGEQYRAVRGDGRWQLLRKLGGR